MQAVDTGPSDQKYWAFISYSHADERFAAWLHRRIEAFAVPHALIGRRTALGSVPRRLRPVFRDRDELPTSADLGAHIRGALERSRFLVVVCSPHAARSHWVNEEVATFKRLGRADRILCVIVGGEPNATDKGQAASECFCPALRFILAPDGAPGAERAEPIAADARPGKDGRAAAHLKIVAGLLGVGFDDLRQRHRRRRRRQVAGWSAAAAALLLGVAGIGVHFESERLSEQNARLLQESREVAARVGALIDREDYAAALRLALAALPTRLDDPERPVEPRLLAQLKRLHHLQGLRHVLGGHGLAGAAVVSPRADRVVTASLREMNDARPDSKAGEVFLWDARTGDRIATLLGPGRSILGDSIQFSADGRFVALNLQARIFPDGGWRVYSALDGRPVDSPRTEEKVGVFAWGRDSIAAIGGEDGTITIYDYAAARAVAVWRTPREGTSLSDAAFDPAGRLLAGTLDDLPEVHLWRVSDGAHLGTFEGHEKHVRSLRFLDDGRALLTVGADQSVRVWDVASRRALHTLAPVDASVAEVNLAARRAITTEWGTDRTVLWSLDTAKPVEEDWASDAGLMRFLSGGERLLVVPGRPDAIPRIVETRSGKELALLEAQAWETVEDVKLSSDGRLMLARTRARRAYLFDVETGRRLASFFGHDGFIVDISMSPDAAVVATASHDGTVRVWSFGPERRAVPLGEGGAIAIDARITRDSRAVLAAYRDRPPVLLELPRGEAVRSFALPDRATALAGAVAPDGSWALLVQSSGTAAWLAGPRFGDKLIALRARHHILKRVAAGARRAMLVADDSVQVWDADEGALLLDLASIRGGVRSATLSPNGERIAIIAGTVGMARDDQQNLAIHAVAGGKRLAVVEIVYARTVSFDPTGRRLLAAGTEGGAALFDAASGTVIRSIAERGLEIHDAHFSPDGHTVLLVSRNGDVHLHETETGRAVAVLRQPDGKPLASRITAEGTRHAVAFDPAGRYVVTATEEGAVLVWDARLETPVARYGGGLRDVRAVRWSPDGRRLILLTADGAIRAATLDLPGDRDALAWARRLDAALRQLGSPP